MKENMFKAVVSAALAGLAAYFQVILVPLAMLVLVMVLDYVSGMVKAWIKSELSSRIGIRGIVKKVGYLGIVAVAMVIDWLIRYGLTQIGIALNFEFFVALLAIIWLIINELISILENLEEAGAPKIPFLSKIIGHLKNSVEKRTGEIVPKEE